jgi:hypothetical protein
MQSSKRRALGSKPAFQQRFLAFVSSQTQESGLKSPGLVVDALQMRKFAFMTQKAGASPDGCPILRVLREGWE